MARTRRHTLVAFTTALLLIPLAASYAPDRQNLAAAIPIRECYCPTHVSNSYYAVLRKGNGPVEDSCAKRFSGVFGRGKMAPIGHAPVCAAFARRTARSRILTYVGPLQARRSP